VSTSERFRTSDNVVAREVGGEFVLLDLTSGTYFGLNPVGGTVWKAMEQGEETFAGLCAAVQQEFDVPEDDLHEDLKSLLDDLREKALIETVGGVDKLVDARLGD
jgi:hypothetical protein